MIIAVRIALRKRLILIDVDKIHVIEFT